MRTAVLCAVRGPVETQVVRALGVLGSPVVVTRRCADLAELLAAAAAGLGVVVVVSADFADLDRAVVRDLHGSGVRVVALADLRTGWGVERVRSLGVDRVVDAPDVEREILLAVVDLAAAAATDEQGRPREGASASAPTGWGSASGAPAPHDSRSPSVDLDEHETSPRSVGIPDPGAEPAPSSTSARTAVRRWTAQALGSVRGVVAAPAPRAAGGTRSRPGGAVTASDPAVPSEATPARRMDVDSGTIIAVWGPTGAPGRSTIAINLAAELVHEGALLVDGDTYGGTVAQMLGLLDEAPGVAAAARAAATGRLDPAALAALTPQIAGGLRVLTGISRPDRWPEVPASSLEVVWACARRLARWTVVDCGFGIEQDEALSYDTRAPRRNAATLSALAAADAVVVVGSGDPIGLQRLVRALGDLADTGVPTGAVQVVVNRVRASASGPRAGEAITDALRRYAGIQEVLLVPEDRPGCDGAVLAARTLREHLPTSPARLAIVGLAQRFAPTGAGVGAH